MNDGDGKLTMLTVVASNGYIYSVKATEIKPDPIYLENQAGIVINSQALDVPEKAKFDIDPKTRLTKTPTNDKPITMADLNGKTTPVYIVVEGFKMTSAPVSAFLEDVAASKRNIRVINEDGSIDEYDVDKNIEFTEMPYAVIVDGDGKPVRTIRVDPVSYINAEDDELVDCTCADKPTKFPKKVIDILS